MSDSWDTTDPPGAVQLSITDWIRVLLRGVTLICLVGSGLIVLLMLRLVERPLWGPRRPLTPHITQVVCWLGLRILGIRHRTEGTVMKGPGAVVANHASWLDIFALNATKRIYFVAKSEVAGWPGIGWLARATGTVFIKRDPREAATQIQVFRDRLAAGHKLLFFPEGTSTDGLRVLSFKPTLFAAFFAPELRDTLQIQPVSLRYSAPPGADPRFYGWWGDMDLAPHLLLTLAARRQGGVTVIYHPPHAIAAATDRKTLAQELERIVRAGVLGQGAGGADEGLANPDR